MADLWNNPLVTPPFAANPPLKVNVPAKILGLVLAILAVLGAIGALLGMIAAFTVGGVVSNVAVNDCNLANQVAQSLHEATTVCPTAVTGGLAIAGLGELVALAAMVLGAWGGFQMYQGIHRGRALVAYSLAIAAIGQLVYMVLWGVGLFIAFFIVYLVIYAVLYYFVMISRFPDESPVVAAPYAGPPPSYGPPNQ